MSERQADNPMLCADFEELLSDYLDEQLNAGQRRLVDQHAAQCAACSELMQDAASALRLLERLPQVEVPPDLVTRIVYQAPAGRVRQPFERRSWIGGLFSDWLQPLLQPRFAMGMAMTIISFAMLGRCTGVQVQQIRPNDLNPVKIWENIEGRAIRTKDRGMKYYENLRLVYEIRSRLNEIRDQQDVPAQDQAQSKSASSGNQQTAPAAPPEGSSKK
jgi:putative zinc finger protein